MDNNIDIEDEKIGGDEGELTAESAEKRMIPSRAFPHFQQGGSMSLTAAEVNLAQNDSFELTNDHDSEVNLADFSPNWGKSGNQDDVVYKSVKESKISDQRVYAQVKGQNSAYRSGFGMIVSGEV